MGLGGGGWRVGHEHSEYVFLSSVEIPASSNFGEFNHSQESGRLSTEEKFISLIRGVSDLAYLSWLSCCKASPLDSHASDRLSGVEGSILIIYLGRIENI